MEAIGNNAEIKPILMKSIIITSLILTALPTAFAAAPPTTSGSVQPLSSWKANRSRELPGIVMGDPEANALLKFAHDSLGFGIGRPSDGNFVSTWSNRNLILGPRCYGLLVDFVVTSNGQSARRQVELYAHELLGSPAGATGKLDLISDPISGRWAKRLIVHFPDGSIDEFSFWSGRVVRADPNLMQSSSDQSLASTAAACNRSTFPDLTLVPMASATTCLDSDKALFGSPNGATAAIKRASAAFDAPMRDASWFPSLCSSDPAVGFLRKAANDDARSASKSLQSDLAAWAKRFSTLASRISKLLNRLATIVTIIVKLFGWL